MTPQLLSLKEAATILGISPQQLRRVAVAGLIPWYDLGPHTLRFSISDVRAYDRATPIPKPKKRVRLPRQGMSPRRRFRILERDGFRCVYCGAGPKDARLVVDHRIAVADGGTDDDDNLVTACEPCNLGKGSRALLVQP